MCGRSYRRKHCPVLSFHTCRHTIQYITLPSRDIPIAVNTAIQQRRNCASNDIKVHICSSFCAYIGESRLPQTMSRSVQTVVCMKGLQDDTIRSGEVAHLDLAVLGCSGKDLGVA